MRPFWPGESSDRIIGHEPACICREEESRLSQVDLIALFSLLIFLLYLSVETVRLRRDMKTISVRIAVSGIRGKSSLTRLPEG